MDAQNNPDNYSAKDIIVLTGPEGVRKRPAMYIGSTGSAGFVHLLYEVIDNAIDEAIAGFCKNITVKLSNENGVDVAEVIDDGRGIPVDIIAKEGKPALEVIMTSMHSGGKFNSNVYKVSGGLHGVGLTVVNSLSEYTEVKVVKNSKIYRQMFSRGLPVSGLEAIGSADPGKSGTTIKFKPDEAIFSVKSFDTLSLNERLRDLSFLNSGITITLVDSREEEEKTTKYFSENGFGDFLVYLRGSTEEVSKPIVMSKDVGSTKIGIVMQYVGNYSEEVISFINNIKTAEGGTHVTGFHTALTRSIINYIEKGKGLKAKPGVAGEDTREGLIAIISIMMQNPEFEGQTKEKLGNQEIKSIVDSAVYSELSTYFEENPSEASKIAMKVIGAAEARESARRARELSRKKSIFEGSILHGKLTDCTEKDPDKAEIFIVEGESAAGSSKQGRDRMFQAILPLKGKILNVEKASEEKIFNNQELHTLVTAMGTGIKEQFNVNNIRYKKVIMLTDADVDGSHIRTLLLTFFYKYMKPVIEQGYIYIAQPPLYKISIGRDVRYAYSDAEMSALLKEHPHAGMQRYKGLGEMNPEQLWETTMNPRNRILKRISIKDAELAKQLFEILMGNDIEARRRFIEEHASEVSFLDI
ncbi:MAG: DNA gyrase subunit B [Candidatus Marsarchaeota archaeon]|nr:DNA gyrase subunit B [Candidatus Marsarchaeota archaeon]